MNVHEAIKDMRLKLGLSQQAFATKLDMSISAIQNYEKDRRPYGKAHVRLIELASENELHEHERVFRESLFGEFENFSVSAAARDRLEDIFRTVLELYQPKLTKTELSRIRARLVSQLKRLAEELDVQDLLIELQAKAELDADIKG